ncbi:Similar to hypothetical protein ASPNIDRAFT_45558 [Aspergillus niger ATCC 1015]; acc. no. EHA21504 [Pyronema omphalodes CBS 100304]|uniref:Something about silencing protein 4 domain-containing protein n=1 Tax=Pyronema omphalodes (strain CBS 100304) TaxID=1076935 RepID=U4LF51_PYROM|nr:Similar to hypothetical protein ASPNIDRAFT_45558 [Aspergillus niger ATCC 1015]; acc. no. EHA21504 [Pyronema omphalodes CBS 100304]
MKMLQQQRPHIILRFSRTVVEEPPQQHTPTTRGTPDTDETLTDDEEERRGKRRRNDTPTTHRPPQTSLSEHQTPLSQTPQTNSSELKRKRTIPKSIGGGKGNLLSPQLFREKIEAARNAQTSQSFGHYGGSLGLSIDGDMEKKEAGRVLRSKDIVKTTEYEEWFMDPTGEYPTNDVPLPIDCKHLSTSCRHLHPRPIPAPLSHPIPEAPKTEDPETLRRRLQPVVPFNIESEIATLSVRCPRFHEDPLDDSVNIERDLLRHNAIKMESDLEKLNSPDWIKLIGPSQGLVSRVPKKILEARKKPLMEHLEVTLEKFRMWSKREKRKRRGSEKDSAERDTEEVETGGEEEEEEAEEEEEEEDVEEESIARKGKKQRTSLPEASPVKKEPPKPEPEFVSFYDKPSLRQQALSNRRKSSRALTAFGQPLPTLEQRDFQLPEELMNDSVALRHARAKRRLSK